MLEAALLDNTSTPIKSSESSGIRRNNSFVRTRKSGLTFNISCASAIPSRPPNGWFATKHGIGLYSNEPFEGEWNREDPEVYQKDIDNISKPIVNESPTGDAKIETYTVANGREGPELGIVIGRLNENNERFIATTKDDSDLSKLISDECINRDCTVKQVESGYSIVSVN